MQKSDLIQIDPFVAQRYILEELCHAHYKDDGSELDKRIEKLWKAMRGTTYHNRDSVCFSFVAAPQQAKTYSCTSAAKMFADALGLTFHKDPDDNLIKELNESGEINNSFILVTYELAGEMSSATTAGLTTKTEVNGKEVMTKLPFMKFAAIEQAAGGMLILDDLANAISGVQNAMFPLLQEKRAGALNLQGKYVATTANRGAIDGTHTAKPSSALVTRGPRIEIKTSADTWLEHVLPFYEGSPTSLVIDSFMLNHGHEHFYKLPVKHGDAAWPGCRTWTSCANQIHTEVLAAQEMIEQGRNVEPIIRQISDRASATIGIDSGTVFTAHVRTWLKGALPCALQVIKNGDMDTKHRKLFDGFVVEKANTAEGADFAMSYAFALACEASNAVIEKVDSGLDIVKDKSAFTKILNNFVNGAYNFGLHEDKISLAMSKFKDSIVQASQTKRKLGRVNDEGMTVVNDDFLMLMTEVVGKNPIARSPHPDLQNTKLYDVTFTEVFSNSAQLESDFERVLARQTAQEFQDIKESIQNLAEETPSLSAIYEGAVREKPVPIEERAASIAEVIEESAPDTEAKVDNSVSSATSSALVDVDELDKMFDSREVEEFKLEKEQDGVVTEKQGVTDASRFKDADEDDFAFLVKAFN